MYVLDHVRTGKHQILVAALEFRAAKILGGKLPLLQHGTHGSIEHQDASGQSLFEGAETLSPGVQILYFHE